MYIIPNTSTVFGIVVITKHHYFFPLSKCNLKYYWNKMSFRSMIFSYFPTKMGSGRH